MWVGRAPPLPSDASLMLGVAGMLRLGKGSVLAVVTRAKRVRGAVGGTRGDGMRRAGGGQSLWMGAARRAGGGRAWGAKALGT